MSRLSLQHEDDCTGYVMLDGAVYIVRGTRIEFTQLGFDASVELEHEGKRKSFATVEGALAALEAKRDKTTVAYTKQFDNVDGNTPAGCALLLGHPNYSHTRMGDGCWRDVVWIYHRCKDSPSNVVLVGASNVETVALYNEVPRMARPR